MQTNIQTTQIDVLRHGECHGGQIFRGITDVALLDKGAEQMRHACEQAQTRWDVICSSPLQRCRHFAEALARQHKLNLVVDQRLQEMCFGAWEARLIEDVWREDCELLTAWGNDPLRVTPPGGESLSAVGQRLHSFYQHLLDKWQGKKILLVMHGGTIRVLMSQLLNIPLSHANGFEVPYACMSRFALYAYPEQETKKVSVKLVAHNFTSPDIR